jgi:hypothetical protein
VAAPAVVQVHLRVLFLVLIHLELRVKVFIDSSKKEVASNVPSLAPVSMKLLGLATLLRVLTVPAEMRLNLVWPCWPRAKGSVQTRATQWI